MPLHQSTEQAMIARRLMRSLDFGVLSTMSSELPGYPFGSITPYVMTPEGQVAIYVSHIAQHTANMKSNSRLCLTVAEQAAGNQQATGRATLVGDAALVPSESKAEVESRYFAFFPEARAYAGTHGFDFYWIEPKRVRYIGGFGKIFWIERAEWMLPTASWQAQEQEVIGHMNADHEESLVNIVEHIHGLRAREMSLLACDPEGCHVRADGKVFYIGFPKPCGTLEALRSAMVELARASK